MNEFKKQTYSEQVADYIRGLILNGELAPGSAVEEAAIAKELSISRAPVREAMQVLVREGLIEAHPQKRKHVKELTAKQIKNSYFAGGVLEAASVANVLDRYTKEDIAKLKKIVREMEKITRNNGSISDLVPLDTEFHDILFSRIDNGLVVELCKRSCQGISKFLLYRHWVRIYTPQEVVERHKSIIEALKTKDPDTVERVLREHYFSSGERMAKYGIDAES
ncbi:MAG: GntR family transcriptional regulator [Desulfopila sp.]|jgi:DNA-binding GntR family transcriptional regulator|nr:GntR family transcriptional regulator [Desulfopila sp.]